MNFYNLTPARTVLALAAAGVIGNLCFMLGDALSSQVSASARSSVPSSIEAARGRFPGEPTLYKNTQRRRAP